MIWRSRLQLQIQQYRIPACGDLNGEVVTPLDSLRTAIAKKTVAERANDQHYGEMDGVAGDRYSLGNKTIESTNSPHEPYSEQ